MCSELQPRQVVTALAECWQVGGRLHLRFEGGWARQVDHDGTLLFRRALPPKQRPDGRLRNAARVVAGEAHGRKQAAAPAGRSVRARQMCEDCRWVAAHPASQPTHPHISPRTDTMFTPNVHARRWKVATVGVPDPDGHALRWCASCGRSHGAHDRRRAVEFRVTEGGGGNDLEVGAGPARSCLLAAPCRRLYHANINSNVGAPRLQNPPRPIRYRSYGP